MTDQAEKDGLAQAAAAAGKEKTSSYLVQMAVEPRIIQRENLGPEHGVEMARAGEDTGLWQDALTVKVPIRSQRKTALLAALETLKLPQDDEHFPVFLRVIDDENGEVFPVRLEQPPAPAPVVKVG